MCTQHPAEDAQERGLARAVLAEDPVHFTGAHFEMGAIERRDWPEAADDAV